MNSLDYRYNFNYNTTKLPWPNNTFKTVYSNGSLGTYGKLYAYKEVLRVLQHGGKLIFVHSGTEKEMFSVQQKIKDAGFFNLRVKNYRYIIYKGKKLPSGTFVATKK